MRWFGINKWLRHISWGSALFQSSSEFLIILLFHTIGFQNTSKNGLDPFSGLRVVSLENFLERCSFSPWTLAFVCKRSKIHEGGGGRKKIVPNHGVRRSDRRPRQGDVQPLRPPSRQATCRSPLFPFIARPAVLPYLPPSALSVNLRPSGSFSPRLCTLWLDDRHSGVDFHFTLC